MIVWGSKGEAVDLGAQESKHCPTCEKERPFHLLLQYKVRHIWYIFKWVSEKQYTLVCEVCHRGEKLVSKAVEAKLQKSPIPFMSRWSWVFLVAAIGCIVLFGAIESTNRSSRTEALLASPKKNDVYVVNVSSLLKSPDSSYMYGLLRVRDISGDQIEFDIPNVMYNKSSGATKDLRNGKSSQPKYFAPTPIVLSREDISRLQQSGAIYSIERD